MRKLGDKRPWPYDPVIEAYKKDVDRTLIRENLKLTVAERLEQAQAFAHAMEESRGAASRALR